MPKYNDGHHDECKSDGLDYWCHQDCSHYPAPKPGTREFHNEIMAVPVPPLPEAEAGSRYIKNRLKELDMEKRGVVLDDEKTKTAGQDKKCPKCGATLNEHSYCSSCGTEPFEKRDDDGSSEEGS